jgi:Spy/CpxP family protein refolding chaperone
MNTIRLLAAAAALLLTAAAVPAQPASGPGPGPGASAPRGGPGGPGRMGRWGSDFTPGWSLMTPAERQEHQARMKSMTDHADCKAYMDEHHEQMAARAKEKGGTMPARPRRDACAGLQR